MENYEEYRLRAAYCREMARAALTIEMKGQWDRLANTWLAMVPRDAEPDAEDFYEAMLPAEMAGLHHHAQ